MENQCVYEDREEGEIVDEYDCIISSEEELNIFKRIVDLEEKNDELEKIARISEDANNKYGFQTQPSHIRIEVHNAVHNSTKLLSPRSKKRRKIKCSKKHKQKLKKKNQKYRKNSYFRKKANCRLHNIDCLDCVSEDSCEFDCRKKTDVSYIHKNLRLAVSYDENKHVTTLKERLLIEKSDKSKPKDFNNEKQNSNESSSLEEQELRLIALKSAIMKKHIARKKKNAEVAYSPTDFEDVYNLKFESEENMDLVQKELESLPIEMEISPVASPKLFLSPSYTIEECLNLSPIDRTKYSVNIKPVDMEIANTESEDENPEYVKLNFMQKSNDRIVQPAMTDSVSCLFPFNYSIYCPSMQTHSMPINVVCDEEVPPPPNFNMSIGSLDIFTKNDFQMKTSFRPIHKQLQCHDDIAWKNDNKRESCENDSLVPRFIPNGSDQYNDDEANALRTLLLAKFQSHKSVKNQNHLKNKFQDCKHNNSLKVHNVLTLNKSSENINHTPSESILKKAVWRLKMNSDSVKNLNVYKKKPEDNCGTTSNEKVPYNSKFESDEKSQNTSTFHTNQKMTFEYNEVVPEKAMFADNEFTSNDSSYLMETKRTSAIHKTEKNCKHIEINRTQVLNENHTKYLTSNFNQGKAEKYKSSETLQSVQNEQNSAQNVISEDSMFLFSEAKNEAVTALISKQNENDCQNIKNPRTQINVNDTPSITKKLLSHKRMKDSQSIEKELEIIRPSLKNPILNYSKSKNSSISSINLSKLPAIQVNRLVIKIRDSDSETSEDETQNLILDNKFNKVSVERKCNFDDLSKKIVSDFFEKNVDNFLKNVRTKVQQKEFCKQNSSEQQFAMKKFMTPSAVHHLSEASQREYQQLVNRMNILEKRRRNAQIKEQILTSPKCSLNTSNLEIAVDISKIKNSETVESLPQHMHHTYERMFQKISTDLVSKLDYSLQLVEKAKKAKMLKLFYGQQLKRLLEEVNETQKSLRHEQELISAIFPKICNLNEDITIMKRKRIEMIEALQKLGKNLSDGHNRFNDHLKEEILEKSKKLALQIKSVNSLQQHHLNKCSKNLAKDSFRSLQGKQNLPKSLKENQVLRDHDKFESTICTNNSTSSKKQNDNYTNQYDPKKNLAITTDKALEDATPSLQLEHVEYDKTKHIKKKTILQKYVSPLTHLECNGSSKIDVQSVLCPFELMGECKDQDCGYTHFSAKM